MSRILLEVLVEDILGDGTCFYSAKFPFHFMEGIQEQYIN